MTSRERLLAAIEHRPVDRVPLCFEGVLHGTVLCINAEHPDPFERARYYLGLGIDHAMQISPPHPPPSSMEIRHREERWTNGSDPVLIKEYVTPKGTLRQVVRKTSSYPHAQIPLFSDHNVPPGRSLEYLVSRESDLPAFECILRPPSGDELARFRGWAKTAKAFCEETGILLVGACTGVGDPLLCLSGIEKVLFSAVEDPGFLEAYMGIVARWNEGLLDVLIDAGVDHVVRRGWYESTDFWSPALYRRFLYEPLRRQIGIAHQAGVKLTYVMNSGALPLLPMFRELGFDVLSNIDPTLPGTDVRRMKAEIGRQICLCGGVNNTHVLERGSEADVERAVREAIEAMAPGSGFILAPGDSPGYAPGTDQSLVRRNIGVMIEAWRRMCGEHR